MQPSQKSYMAKESTIKQEWHIVDATGMPLGRLASQVANILKGKHKPTYTPHVDCGDFVIITNTDKVVLTGKKLDQKIKFSHSQYMGGAKYKLYRKYMEDASDDAVYEAIQGMLPKTRLGRKQLKKLRCYKDANHNHQAQQPKVLELIKKNQ
jgi:large subunit ribosomal protein L13